MMRCLAVSALVVFATQAFGSVSINGAGSTFAEPIYTRWMADFEKSDKSVRFNYQGIGSGAGIKQLLGGTIDFAGTDDPMKADEVAKAKAGVLHVPIAMGAVVVTYNLPELDAKKPIRLSGPVIAKIFNGTIKKWNDAEIVKLNPDVKMPDLAVAVATRADASGTTAVFSEYLAKVSKDWEGKSGKTVKWFPGSIGAKGNAGVTGLVKQTPGTIGYVELVYALENKLPSAIVQNKSGNFIEPTPQSVSVAAQGITKEAIAKEFKVSITDSAQKGAYPIAAFTWMLVYDKMPEKKGSALVKFAKWILSEDAQKTASSINYAPVPKEIRAEAVKALNKVKFE